MNNINRLKLLVINGFTIKNRRDLQKLIGKDEYEKLSKFADRFFANQYKAPVEEFTSFGEYNPTVCCDGLALGYWQGQINLKIKPYVSSIQNPYNTIQIFTGCEIKKDNIVDRIKSYIFKIIKDTKTTKTLDKSALDGSSTLDKLYSPAFKIKQGINKDGYYVTTLLDKQSGKPVKAYVKQIGIYQQYNKPYEIWGIFLKDTNGKYTLFGSRSFGIDKERKMIIPGNMNSQGGFSTRYAGIGLRGHQIAIERMIQEGLDGIEICSVGQAFPFHYKAGFRVIEKVLKVSPQKFDLDVKKLAGLTGFSESEILELMPRNEKNGVIEINSKSIEEIKKKIYLENNKGVLSGDLPMILPQDKLSAWLDRINSQPILLS